MFQLFFKQRLTVFIYVIIASGIFIQSCKPKTDKDSSTATADTTAASRALSEISAKIQSDPNNADLLYQRSRMLMSARDFNKSMDDIRKALSIDSSKATYFIQLADLYFISNKTQLSKQNLEKAIVLDPSNMDANMKLAEIYFYVKQYDKSIAFLDGVLKADVHNAKAYFMKGMNFKEKGDTNDAISSFQTTLEQNQTYYSAYMQLAIIMHSRSNPLALQYYDAAIRLDPKSEEAFYGRGLYFQDHDELDKAIQDYTTLSQINPKNKQAYFNLGYLHYTYLKVYDQAVKHYTQAIACDSYYAEAFYNRGLSYEAMGNIEAAKQDYEKALSLRPDYALAANGLKRVQR